MFLFFQVFYKKIKEFRELLQHLENGTFRRWGVYTKSWLWYFQFLLTWIVFMGTKSIFQKRILSHGGVPKQHNNNCQDYYLKTQVR